MSLNVQQNYRYTDADVWEWSVWLEGTKQELDEVERVEYTLDPSFRPSVRSVDNRASKFRLNEITSGPFLLYVKAVHKDKPPTLLEHYLELAYPDGTPPAKEDSTLVFLKQTVFANGNRAQLAFTPVDSDATDILATLRIPQPRMLILLSGGDVIADQKLKLLRLFRGMVDVAGASGALIIDGGIESGVTKLMGLAVAEGGFRTSLIGIAPAANVAYPGSSSGSKDRDKAQLDPNHSHFVLVDCVAAGCEIDTRYALADEFVSRGTNVTTLVVNGGSVAAQEVVRSVRRHFPIVVIKKSGGLADKIADAWGAPERIRDPAMAEIIADGKLEFHSLDSPVESAQLVIALGLEKDEALQAAWDNFADYDLNSILQRIGYRRMQRWIVVVGILGTTLALINQVWNGNENVASTNPSLGWQALHYILIALPITLTILIAAANRFRLGDKWLLLRAAAEGIKREIYRYRTRTGDYASLPTTADPETTAGPDDGARRTLTPQQTLSQRIEIITHGLMLTEANSSSIVPYQRSLGSPENMYATYVGDDGFSPLSPDRYVEVRLGDQLKYYRAKAVQLARKLRNIQWSIFIIGGLGTLLAAIGQQVWIALTTTLTAALMTHLNSSRTEDMLTKYNQAATDLDNVKSWWVTLSEADRENPANMTALVDHTEQVLQSEFEGWVQQTRDLLANLRDGQGSASSNASAEDDQPASETTAASTASTNAAAEGAAEPESSMIAAETPNSVGEAEAIETDMAGEYDESPPSEAIS